jgi:hypothetical protein
LITWIFLTGSRWTELSTWIYWSLKFKSFFFRNFERRLITNQDEEFVDDKFFIILYIVRIIFEKSSKNNFLNIFKKLDSKRRSSQKNVMKVLVYRFAFAQIFRRSQPMRESNTSTFISYNNLEVVVSLLTMDIFSLSSRSEKTNLEEILHHTVYFRCC